MNWSYYSHYVGDIFGAPLAIEGLMAFFLEATFVGLFFFGWDKLSKVGHLVATWAVAIGSNFSALWILIANGWMQNPVGVGLQSADHAHGGHRLLRGAVQPGGAGQVRAHRVGRLRRAPSIFVLGVSAWYLLQGPPRRARQALDDGGRLLRPRRRAVGRRARRRERLPLDRAPEDEARRHRGDVGDRAGAGRLHRLRLPRPGRRARRTTRSTSPG